MSEFKPGDIVLIDCSNTPHLGPNTVQAKIVVAYPEGIYRYGCATDWHLYPDRISIWCRSDQLKKLELQETQT